jgi:hypothetical protein
MLPPYYAKEGHVTNTLLNAAFAVTHPPIGA